MVVWGVEAVVEADADAEPEAVDGPPASGPDGVEFEAFPFPFFFAFDLEERDGEGRRRSWPS